MSVKSNFKFEGCLVDAKELAIKLNTEKPTIGGTKQVLRIKILITMQTVNALKI